MAAEREEELLRLNAELAAEIRRLAAGEIKDPRTGSTPAARSLSRLAAEREQLLSQREDLREERDRLRAQLEEQVVRGDSLAAGLVDVERRNSELAHEVKRLRSGIPGLARRAWARLMQRR